MIERAVAKDPDDRYPTAGGLIDAAREHEGATPAATRVLSDTPGRPTAVIAPRGGRRWRERLGRPGGAGAWLAIAILAVICVVIAAAAMLLLGGDEVSVSTPIAIGQRPAADRDRRALGLGDERPRRDAFADRRGDRRRSPASRCTLGRGVCGRRGRRRLGLGGEPAHAARSCASTATRARSRTGSTVGGRPGAIVFGGDRVWVADEGGGGVTAINAPGGQGLQARDRPAHRAAAARGRRRRRLGQQRRDRQRCAASTSARRSPAPPIAGRPRPARGSPSAAASSGSPTAAPTASPGSTRRPGRCSASRSRSAAGPAGIDAGTSVVWVANARRRHGQPHRHRERRNDRRPDRGRPPPRRRRGRRGSGLGGRQR